MQHTPGPWTAHSSKTLDGAPWWYVKMRPDAEDEEEDLMNRIDLAAGMVSSPRMGEADARLIAQAPEMYDALQAAWQFVEAVMDGGVMKHEAVALATRLHGVIRRAGG